jgi:hypothetical protein
VLRESFEAFYEFVLVRVGVFITLGPSLIGGSFVSFPLHWSTFSSPLKPLLSGHDLLLKIAGNFFRSILLRGNVGR